jgi:hypothetical protein
MFNRTKACHFDIEFIVNIFLQSKTLFNLTYPHSLQVLWKLRVTATRNCVLQQHKTACYSNTKHIIFSSYKLKFSVKNKGPKIITRV